MPTKRAKALRGINTGGALQQGHCARSSTQFILSLPSPSIELVLISYTSINDKKALRRTCKLFRDLLDDNMVCMNLQTRDSADHLCLELWLQRMQRSRGLKTLALTDYSRKGGCLVQHLPEQLTTVVVTHSFLSTTFDLKLLNRLRYLKNLSLSVGGEVTGLETITGLTSLRFNNSSTCSVAHLAPTLKCLGILTTRQALGLSRLTNLEALEVINGPLSAGFFATHSQLPLKHLYMNARVFCTTFIMHQLWASAPPTLAHLALHQLCSWRGELLPGVLPQQITHLQLSYVHTGSFKEITSALQQLQHLDVFLRVSNINEENNALTHLSKLTDLKTLGVYVEGEVSEPSSSWSREKIQSAWPEVAKAAARGVQVNSVPPYSLSFYGLGSWSVRPAWASYHE